MIKRVLFSLLLLQGFIFGCSSYVSRPTIEGNIYDSKGNRIQNVDVLTWNGKNYTIETHSNSSGRFVLEKKRKRGIPDDRHLMQFLLQKKSFKDTMISEFYCCRTIKEDTTVIFNSLVMKSK